MNRRGLGFRRTATNAASELASEADVRVEVEDNLLANPVIKLTRAGNGCDNLAIGAVQNQRLFQFIEVQDVFILRRCPILGDINLLIAANGGKLVRSYVCFGQELTLFQVVYVWNMLILSL